MTDPHVQAARSQTYLPHSNGIGWNPQKPRIDGIGGVHDILMESNLNQMVRGIANIAGCGCQQIGLGRSISIKGCTRETNTQRSMIMMVAKNDRTTQRAFRYLKAQRISFTKRRCTNLASSGMCNDCIRALCARRDSSIRADRVKVALVKQKMRRGAGRVFVVGFP